ncbi:MAG: hypothetical protein HQL69_19635, partial [Magnetococcales bacterium]|nr:hypothetical protein [Magnetococcales bacterium]
MIPITMPLKYKFSIIPFVSILAFIIFLGVLFNVNRDNAVILDDIVKIHFPALEQADANLIRLDRIKEALQFAVSAGELEMTETAQNYAKEMRAS